MRKATTAVGALVAVVCAWFVLRRLSGDWPAARHAVGSASVGWLAMALVLAVAGMTVIAVGWSSVLRELGHRRPLPRVVAWYYAGEIGKYVPGGVWPVVGRGELARRGDVPRAAAYSSVVLSLGLLYLAAAVLAAALLPFALDAAHGPLLLVLVAPVLGVLALHPVVSARVEALASRMLRRPIGIRLPSFTEALALLLRYVPAWLGIGGATWAVARALDPHAGLTRVLLATTVSWLAGFLVVPVPGGVGVREAVFVAVAGLPAGVGESTAVLARVGFVVVDAGGALLSARLVPRRRSSTAPAGEPPAPRTSG